MVQRSRRPEHPVSDRAITAKVAGSAASLSRPRRCPFDGPDVPGLGREPQPMGFKEISDGLPAMIQWSAGPFAADDGELTGRQITGNPAWTIVFPGAGQGVGAFR